MSAPPTSTADDVASSFLLLTSLHHRFLERLHKFIGTDQKLEKEDQQRLNMIESGLRDLAVEAMRLPPKEFLVAALNELHPRKLNQSRNDLRDLRAAVNLVVTGLDSGDPAPALRGSLGAIEPRITNLKELCRDLVASSKISGLDKRFSDVSNKLDELEAERKARQASAAAIKYHDECSDAIRYHRNFAIGSLIAFLTAITLTLRLVFWQSTGDGQLFFCCGPVALPLPDNTDAWHFAAFVVGKLILASFSVGICVITCRVYLAHQHNIITLRHQKLSATALREFFDTIPPESNDARLQVVTQCVTAITAREPSGFLKEDVKDYTAYTMAMQKLLEMGKK